MNKSLDSAKIATLTGKAVQDDETFKSEGGFVPERDQFYFEMKQGNNVFFVGFKDLLICLKLMEQMQEIPPISIPIWRAAIASHAVLIPTASPPHIAAILTSAGVS